MAKKRSIPIEDPPTSSSSEEEEVEEEENVESSEGEDLEEEGTQNTTQVLKTPKNTGNSAGAVESDESETDSDGDSDSSSSNVKPIAIIPVKETPNAMKTRSKAMASSVKASGAKRPSESQQEPKEVKRPKKKAEEKATHTTAPAAGEEAKKTREDTKKQLFQRLFSEDDEIAVLKGMLDYYAKEGTDPCTDMSAFYDFVEKSIHADVTKAQLVDKIRRLKKKFENNKKRGKNGEDKTFAKPHEQKSFDLSKKIWGKEGFTGDIESSAVKSNGNAKKKNNELPALKEEKKVVDEEPMDEEEVEDEEPVDVDNKGSTKVGDGEPMDVGKKGSNSRDILFHKRFGVAGQDEEQVLKLGLEMAGGKKRAALEDKYRKLQLAEMKVFMQRHELVKEAGEILLEYYK